MMDPTNEFRWLRRRDGTMTFQQKFVGDWYPFTAWCDVPIVDDEPIPYRITDKGRVMLKEGK